MLPTTALEHEYAVKADCKISSKMCRAKYNHQSASKAGRSQYLLYGVLGRRTTPVLRVQESGQLADKLRFLSVDSIESARVAVRHTSSWQNLFHVLDRIDPQNLQTLTHYRHCDGLMLSEKINVKGGPWQIYLSFLANLYAPLEEQDKAYREDMEEYNTWLLQAPRKEKKNTSSRSCVVETPTKVTEPKPGLSIPEISPAEDSSDTVDPARRLFEGLHIGKHAIDDGLYYPTSKAQLYPLTDHQTQSLDKRPHFSSSQSEQSVVSSIAVLTSMINQTGVQGKPSKLWWSNNQHKMEIEFTAILDGALISEHSPEFVFGAAEMKRTVRSVLDDSLMIQEAFEMIACLGCRSSKFDTLP